MPTIDWNIGLKMIAIALAIGLGTIGTGLGQGNAVSGAMEAIGRNPDAQGKVQGTLILGLAFIESLAIYALVIAFLIGFGVFK